MLRPRAKWFLVCLACSLGGVLLAGLLTHTLNPILWFALHSNGATLLPRGLFELEHHLELLAAEGFLLGLVPIDRLRDLNRAHWARFRSQPSVTFEGTWHRPLLWAWAPLAVVLLWRALTFNTGSMGSVLGRTYVRETRFDHFFAPLTLAHTPAEYLAIIVDRYLLVGPMLLLLAYTIGVWLRHALPPTGREVVSEQVTS